uniref:Integrase core domain containing protein n=1 Tax=Solanum tuberosum TaxID=4113 RepID=M1DWY6_SOLTU
MWNHGGGLRSVGQSTNHSTYLWFPSEPNFLGLLTYGGDPRTVGQLRNLGTMAPKKAPAVAAKGRCKSMALTRPLIDEDTDAENDPTYVPPTGRTSPTAPQTTHNQSKEVVPDVVTASQFDNEDIWIGSPAGSAFGSESASASGSASRSAIGSSSHVRAASSDEATSAGYILVPPNTDPTSVTEEPNRWDFGVLVWHCDKLIEATKTLDIGLIRDEANLAAPTREPQVNVTLLGADIVADVEQMQDADPTPPATTDYTTASPS